MAWYVIYGLLTLLSPCCMMPYSYTSSSTFLIKRKCLFYLAIVKYDKTDEYIRTKLEPFLHAIPLLIATGNYIVRLVTQSLNPGLDGNCSDFIYAPPHCREAESGFVIEGLFELPCGCGRSSFIANMYLFTFVLFCPPIVMITSLVVMYRTVVRLENKQSQYGARTLRNNINQIERGNDGKIENGNTRGNRNGGGFTSPVRTMDSSSTSISNASAWQKVKKGVQTGRESLMGSIFFRFDGGNSNNTKTSKMKPNKSKRSKSRSILNKAMAYSCSWLLTWVFWLVYSIFIIAGMGEEIPSSIVYLKYIFMPLQGLYNLTIFMHPKILNAKRSKRNNLNWCQAFVKAFWSKGKDNNKKGRGARGTPTALRNGNGTGNGNGNSNNA